MRTIGIDPGTVSIDLCGLEHGRVFLDRAIPTADAVADPAGFVAQLQEHRPVTLIVGPSGYGVPLTDIRDIGDETLRLAYLAVPDERGGIGGLRALARALAASDLPVVLTPAVAHLPTVPPHRKVNRVDLGTADKLCVAALAVHEQAERLRCRVDETSFVLLELGGAFTAVLVVDRGRIIDGVGGSAGPLGFRASGALDGEVAFLAGRVSKAMLFQGGAASIHGDPEVTPERFAEPRTAREALAWDAYIESTVKTVAQALVTLPGPREILLSGRVARVEAVRRELTIRLAPLAPVMRLHGVARVAKEAAQGAALIANGLAGGEMASLTDTLAIRDATGTVLDHLYVLSPDVARRRLGLA